jgi:hypothetical protein
MRLFLLNSFKTNNMETKDIKITIPEGYEIDMEKSTFERIVFKKKKTINSWEDLEKINGVFIDYYSNIQNCEALPQDENRNMFLNEKYAKSALALSQISQLLPYYDSNVNWNRNTIKYCIARRGNEIYIDTWQSLYNLLAFKSREEAERFLKYNEQLVKDYFMM